MVDTLIALLPHPHTNASESARMIPQQYLRRYALFQESRSNVRIQLENARILRLVRRDKDRAVQTADD